MTEIAETTAARLELTIRTPQETFTISCLCHRSEDSSKRHIEAWFYESESPEGIPQGVHHEMELLSGPWVRPGLTPTRMHIHPNRETGKKFVCWTGSLPSIELATVVFERWAVGTIYTITTGQDFVPMVEQLNNDWDAIYSCLEKDFSIKLADTKVVE